MKKRNYIVDCIFLSAKSIGCLATSIMLCAAPAMAQGFQAPLESPPPSGTIIPTDVVPLPAAQERTTFGENLQLRILQRLPSKLYFNVTTETSIRDETNVFQYPTKRKYLQQLTTPQQFRTSNAFQQGQILNSLNKASANDAVLRVFPNMTVGYSLKPRTRVYGNFFMIRDELMHWTTLDTIIYSLSYGAQQDIPVGRKGNIQLDMQFRELWQLHAKPVMDFLPNITYSHIVTPRMVVYASALGQFRGRGYFRSPNREIDPFYTFGGYYVRGGWSFSASNTFVQNFREPFHSGATIPINDYTWISDYEIARRVVRQLPGLQVFARAEPIWNFHSHAHPGLTGMDFRMYFGVRLQVGKPALTAALEKIRQQLQEQEVPPIQPEEFPEENKPSAMNSYPLALRNPQPIHGYINDDASTKPLIAQLNNQAQEEALRLAKAEAERIAQEEAKIEADRKAQEEALKLAKAETDRRVREEVIKLARAEADRKAQEEAVRLAKAAAERKAQEETIRLARAEAERIAQEDALRLAKAEAERIAQEETIRLAKIESDRKVQGEAIRLARAEAERKVQGEAIRLARAEAERIAQEEAIKLAKVEAERRAREEAIKLAKVEADRRAQEETIRLAKIESDRKARIEVDRRAREDALRLAKAEAERIAQEEVIRLAKIEADRKEKEEAIKLAKAEETNKKTKAKIELSEDFMFADRIQSLHGHLTLLPGPYDANEISMNRTITDEEHGCLYVISQQPATEIASREHVNWE